MYMSCGLYSWCSVKVSRHLLTYDAYFLETKCPIQAISNNTVNLS